MFGVGTEPFFDAVRAVGSILRVTTSARSEVIAMPRVSCSTALVLAVDGEQAGETEFTGASDDDDAHLDVEQIERVGLDDHLAPFPRRPRQRPSFPRGRSPHLEIGEFNGHRRPFRRGIAWSDLRYFYILSKFGHVSVG